MNESDPSKIKPRRFEVSILSVFSEVNEWKQVGELTTTIKRANNGLVALTVDIVKTYTKCNNKFKTIEVLPQRILTNPSEAVLNNGSDNSESNLICRVHDKLLSPSSSFTILDLLGTGTFGQVFRCKKEGTSQLVAVKVIKNKPAYYSQGMLEIKIAKLLNNHYDPNNEKHIVRLLESFEYRGHVCVVFELLSMTLLDVLTQNQYRGLSLSIVQRITKQILIALSALEDANVIHCDLKPENILIAPSTYALKPLRKSSKTSSSSNSSTEKTNPSTNANEIGDSSSSSPMDGNGNSRRQHQTLSDIKVIDFGSACFEGRTVYSYIQSRFCKLLF